MVLILLNYLKSYKIVLLSRIVKDYVRWFPFVYLLMNWLPVHRNLLHIFYHLFKTVDIVKEILLEVMIKFSNLGNKYQHRIYLV